MKVIFLDIEGVLDTVSFTHAFWQVLKNAKASHVDAKHLGKLLQRDKFGNHFDPIAVENLDMIIRVFPF